MDKKEEKEVVYVKDYYGSHKVLIWVFILVLILLLALVLYTRSRPDSKPANNNDTVVVIQPNGDVSIGVGNSINLFASVDGNLNQVITWKSSDEKIAIVNSNGVVTGKSYGKVTILASFIDKNGKSHDASKIVTVADGDSKVEVTDVKFPDGDLYMPINSSYQLSMVLVPSNGLISEKTFTSSNSSAATVDENGVINSTGIGYSRIIATINGKFKRAINVYVSNEYQKPEIIVSPTSVSFGNDTRKIKVGDVEQLSYNITPSNSDRSKIIWSSSDSSIVSVSNTGIITGKKEGKAIISLSTINGKKDSIIVEVYNEIVPVTDIIVSETKIKMNAGQTQTITPVVVPDNASNKGLSYTSLDNSIVSVIPTNDGKSVTLSALKAGTTTVVISSNNVEKRLDITVEGNGNNSSVDDDDINLPTTIRVRSNKNNLAKTYEEVKNIPVSGVTTVSVQLQIGVGKIKYCVNRYGAYNCTPDIDMAANDTIEIPSGGIYVIRIKKYDYSGNEISSNSVNYIDGVLNYYVNTTAKEVKAKEYRVTNAYTTESYAKALPKYLSDKVTIKLLDATRYLKVCYTKNDSCTPVVKVPADHNISFYSEGLWKIFINEYDENNNKIGNTETYYTFIKANKVEPTKTSVPANTANPTKTPTTTNIPKTSGNTTSDNVETYFGLYKLTASNLLVNSQVLIGKYLAVDVQLENKFESVRFCYNVAEKDSNNFCELDLKSASVSKHNGQSYFHPSSENTTFYATFPETKEKTLWFDIDGLDNLYDNSNTSNNVLFTFAIGMKSGSKIAYSNPIKVRIRMNKRVGNDSDWTSKFIIK